ncbi:MAG: tetratricopeptide repeat protein [Phocaeicola sp.]
MKGALHLLLLISMVCNLTGCKHNRYPQILQTADSLTTIRPDSAVVLLTSLEKTMQQAPQATQMYYNLLCIKANDKAYKTHTSDSLIRAVLNYYVEKEEKQHLPEAYYYGGRVYRDLGDAPQALEYFQKAEELLPDTAASPLKSFIYSQIGTLFLYQGLYHEALEVFKRDLECVTQLKDSVGMIYTYRDMATTYKELADRERALHYYESAYQLANKLERNDLASMVQSQLASLYISLKWYDLAELALKEAQKEVKPYNESATYSIAAEYYHRTGQLDSATHYYQALLNMGSIYAKEAAHRGLAEIASNNGESKLTIKHIQKFLQYSDSIQAITYTEGLHRMQALYNYQLRANENFRLKEENQTKNNLLLICLVGLVVISAIAFSYHQYAQQKKQKLNYQLQRALQLKEEIYKGSQAFVEEKNVEVEKLQASLNSVSTTNKTLQEEVKKQQKLLFHQRERVQLEQERVQQTKEAISQTPICQLLHARLLDPRGEISVTSQEWSEIRDTLNEYYPNFFEKLNEIHHFSTTQLQICMLIKAGFSPSDIAKLTEIPKQTISSTRSRLYLRIFQEKGNPKDWDNFITSL